MKLLSRALFGFALLGAVLFATGCASDGTTAVPGQNKHSSMPQNLPQSWEGQGMLGGMAGYQ